VDLMGLIPLVLRAIFEILRTVHVAKADVGLLHGPIETGRGGNFVTDGAARSDSATGHGINQPPARGQGVVVIVEATDRGGNAPGLGQLSGREVWSRRVHLLGL